MSYIYMYSKKSHTVLFLLRNGLLITALYVIPFCLDATYVVYFVKTARYDKLFYHLLIV